MSNTEFIERSNSIDPTADTVGTAADETLAPVPAESTLDAYSPLQRHTLARFTRLTMLRRDLQSQVGPTDWRTRLLNKALYSTYRDCLEQELQSEAELLRTRG